MKDKNLTASPLKKDTKPATSVEKKTLKSTTAVVQNLDKSDKAMAQRALHSRISVAQRVDKSDKAMAQKALHSRMSAAQRVDKSDKIGAQKASRSKISAGQSAKNKDKTTAQNGKNRRKSPLQKQGKGALAGQSLMQKPFYSVLILTAIAVISALILSLVNLVTVVDQNAMRLEKIAKFYPEASVVAKNIDVSQAEDDFANILFAVKMSDGALAVQVHSKKAYSAEGLELLVFLAGDQVVRVCKFAASETPGVGSKVVSDAYLARFSGKNIADFEPYPYTHGVVDAVTGATKTSNGVKYAVGAAVQFYISVRGTI